MTHAAEFDALLSRVRAMCEEGGGRPTLFLSWDAEKGDVRSSGARLVPAPAASRERAAAYAADPVFADGGKALRRMRAAEVVSECRRLGEDPLRPGSKRRARPKRELVERLLARLAENVDEGESTTGAGE